MIFLSVFELKNDPEDLEKGYDGDDGDGDAGDGDW